MLRRSLLHRIEGAAPQGGPMLTRSQMMMNDQIKSGHNGVAQISPGAWFVRGRLPFDQGIMFIRHYFSGKDAADVYNHTYFMEKEQFPQQPSPQLHLTEEIQACMRIVRGNTTFFDHVSRLDNTMGVFWDRDVALGATLYNPIEVDALTKEKLQVLYDRRPVKRIVVPTRQTWRSLETYMEKFPNAEIFAPGDVAERFAESHPGRVQVLKGDTVRLTEKVTLYRIPGDDLTNEYVLYDKASFSFFCTDLFHGGYNDYDPWNSWLCRVWGKLQREGDYKSVTILPKFKEAQIAEHGDMSAVQGAVDLLTRKLSIDHLVFAHGTPALRQEIAVKALRAQWDLPY